LAIPLIRITIFAPPTINIKEALGSLTIFLKLSIRLFPLQSGINRFFSLSSRTTLELSPLGLASTPLGPTVAKVHNEDA